MGTSAESEIDGWLRSGGLVVTASDRATRAVASAFHRARRAEGLTAWPAPNILDWKTFVRAAWEEHSKNGGGDGRLLLNPTQEQALWAEIAGSHNHLATLLEGPRHRLARLAMEAHELICSYAPNLLRASARSAWQQDAAAFSDWLSAFDQTCRAANLLSSARLPLELIQFLSPATGLAEQSAEKGEYPNEVGETHISGAKARTEPADLMPGINPWPAAGKSFFAASQAPRPALLLAGFDRILPIQRSLFDAWGEWRQAIAGHPAAQILFHQAPDALSELAACALWCIHKLADNPNARLLVITQDAADRTRRGQIERAFLKHTGSMQTGPASSPLFEFSLGIPLSQVDLPNAAYLLLRWLSGPLAEHELDWLFSTRHAAANPQEASALQAHMHTLRRRGLQQPQWTLKAFIGFPPNSRLPDAWVNRMAEAQRRLAEFARRPQTPLDWVELVPQLLDSAGFPGANPFSGPLSSAEFQAAHRWQQAVETCGSLGFDGRRMQWKEFLSMLARTLDETLFAPESRDAPIQIAGPAESAGLTADAVWFLGANEDAWPAGGATHPLLPQEVQRQADMPHASPQLDWDLAQAITTRLIAAAPDVHFSCAKQNAGVEARPSRAISQLVGIPQPLPPELTAPASRAPLTIPFEDFSRIPFPPGKVRGGASVLTSQSQCAFKAFATARLAAQSWEPAEAGLTASQRGQLLHAVLHAIWAGPPDGIGTLNDLQNLLDRRPFAANHVHRALRNEIQPGIRDRMPPRYLELEEQRLTNLVTEWLDYESARIDFEVTATEIARTIHLAGLTFDLRLDRIDRLNDGSLLVIDYKSGSVSPKSWDLPRPDDVQLPLYAGFALDREEEMLGGLVFAKLRAGDQSFAGRVGDAKATLLANLAGSSALVKNSLSAELLIDWRAHIEQLAGDFLAGRAEVNPREYPKTCERCGLQTLCRIQESENQPQLESEEDSDSAEAADG
jgi:probable DNA repair protein